MLQKQAGHNPMRHVILVPGVSPVRSRRGAHYARRSTPGTIWRAGNRGTEGKPTHTRCSCERSGHEHTHTPIDRKKKKDACSLLLLRTGPFCWCCPRRWRSTSAVKTK